MPPFLRVAATGAHYHVMGAAEGLAIGTLLWWMVRHGVAALSRGWRPREAPTERKVPPPSVPGEALRPAPTGNAAPRPGGDLRLSDRTLTRPDRAGQPGRAAGAHHRHVVRTAAQRARRYYAPPRSATQASPWWARPARGAPIQRNRHALDVAARHGLRMWLADYRFGGHTTLEPRWPELVSEALADYRDHPALDGYFVEDEPTAGMFPMLGALSARGCGRAIRSAWSTSTSWPTICRGDSAPPAIANISSASSPRSSRSSSATTTTRSWWVGCAPPSSPTCARCVRSRRPTSCHSC